MSYILKGAKVYSGGSFVDTDIAVCKNTIESIGKSAANYPVIDCTGCHIFPGFTDVHIHLREPGFSYKETIASGTRAAAAGGYTAVCSMPNLNPVPDSAANMKCQTDIIERDAVIAVHPYAAITVGEMGERLSDMKELAEVAVAFSDDGRGVQSESLMREAMLTAKSLGKMIVAHCEENSLLCGGYIHSGEYAKAHSHRGICSESEWVPIKRDIELVRETGCRYHICHISTKESVELIRRAKADGLPVTCETAPHYLVFNDGMLREDGRFKMNPPIRAEADRLALLEGIKDGTINMIATDHAPHSAEEKSRGLEKSLMGVVGLETAFSVLYKNLVKTKIITLEKLIRLMSVNPNGIFGIGSEIKEGMPANLTVFDLAREYTVNSENFISKGRSSPFDKEEVSGKCILTMYEGDIVWKENLTENLTEN